MAVGGKPTFLTNLEREATVMCQLDSLEKDLNNPLKASVYIDIILMECYRDEVRQAFQKVSKIFGHGISFDVFFAFNSNSFGDSSNRIIWVGAGEHRCVIVDNEFPDERFVLSYGLDLKTRKYTLTTNKKLPFSEKVMQFIEEKLNRKINQYIKRVLA